MLPSQPLGEAARRFLLDGVNQGIRNDGRRCFDYRRISFETQVISSAIGSVRLRAGETDLLVGIKCEVGKPDRERPDAGHFQICVDCAASVSPKLVEGHAAEDWGRHMATLLESMCGGDDVVDRKGLCIVPGLFAWHVNADILVLSSGGNLLDTMSLALCIILGDMLLPGVRVQEALEEGEPTQLAVDDRPEVGVPFPLKKLPLCITVAQLGEEFLLDVTHEEESCANAMLCVVVDGKCGSVIGMHKLGRGLYDISAVPPMLEKCKATAAALIQQLNRELSLKTYVAQS